MTTTTDEQALVEDAGKRLAECDEVGLSPSVFVFSGRGCWGCWKLDRPVTQLEADRLMRRLFALFRRGGTEWGIGRIARMPGSVNSKTGLRSFVIAVRTARIRTTQTTVTGTYRPSAATLVRDKSGVASSSGRR